MNRAYFIWIPLAIVYNALACYFSVKYNGKSFVSTYLSVVACGFIPTWAIAAYYSRNLILDSLIFDMVLVLSSPVVLLFLGQGHAFTTLNWIGVGLTLAGLLCARWPS